jgi:hypothetical protein
VVERRKSHRQEGVRTRANNRIWKRSCGKQKRSPRRIEQPSDLWELERYRTERRKEIDRQYDYRYSVLLTVFADLIQKGRLREPDLQRLSAEKLRHIHHRARAGGPFVESAKSLGKPSPPLQPSFGLGSQSRGEPSGIPTVLMLLPLIEVPSSFLYGANWESRAWSIIGKQFATGTPNRPHTPMSEG